METNKQYFVAQHTPNNTISIPALSGEELISSKILIEKLIPEAVIPSYAHDGDLGLDVTATSVEYDKTHDRWIYHTGLTIATPRAIGCFAMPRSKNVSKEVYLPNSIGLIDTYIYRGELCFMYKARTSLETEATNLATHKFFRHYESYRAAEISFEKIYEEACEQVRINRGANPPYKVGERIGQIVFFINVHADTEEAQELNDTVRGAGGFGASGN